MKIRKFSTGEVIEIPNSRESKYPKDVRLKLLKLPQKEFERAWAKLEKADKTKGESDVA